MQDKYHGGMNGNNLWIKREVNQILWFLHNRLNAYFKENKEQGTKGVHVKPFFLLIGAGASPGMWDQTKVVLREILNQKYESKEKMKKDLQGYTKLFEESEFVGKLQDILSEPTKDKMIHCLIEDDKLLGKIIHNHRQCKKLIKEFCSMFSEVEKAMEYRSRQGNRIFRRKSLSAIMATLILLFDPDFQVIFSTNWDTVIEHTFEEIRNLRGEKNTRKYKKILNINNWNEYFSNKDRFSFGLVKLNGCYEENNVVLFVEYKDTKNPIKREKAQLMRLFEDVRKGSLLVAGHGCSYDKWIIEKLSRRSMSRLCTYWSAIKDPDMRVVGESDFNCVSLSSGFSIISFASNKWENTGTGKINFQIEYLDSPLGYPNPYYSIVDAISCMSMDDPDVIALFEEEATWLLDILLEKINHLKDQKKRVEEKYLQDLLHEKKKKALEREEKILNDELIALEYLLIQIEDYRNMCKKFRIKLGICSEFTGTKTGVG